MKQKSIFLVLASTRNKDTIKMNRITNFFIVLLAVGIGAILMFIILNWEKQLQPDTSPNTITYAQPPQNQPKEIQKQSVITGQTVDFRAAATSAVKSVVHVKTQYTERARYNNPFLEFFYGYDNAPTREVQNAGSGVIISPDGYIVTNNHVIQRSDRIKVVLNDQREFPAQLIGKDKNTDLALLKIEATNLDTIRFANSDEVALGEWVLAVGNPYNLTSTVTAGIVSAKARSISNPRTRRMSLDAFIQTDAVVNPGNSGGALVNTKGNLVGINTAIQSTTGAYVGYSFAIPSNVVAKVAEDLKSYGMVRRGYLGVQIATVTDDVAKQLQLDSVGGVIILGVHANGAAAQAGLQAKDVIVSVNEIDTDTVEQLQEQLAKYSPDDEIKISVKRDGIMKHFTLKLRNGI